MREPLVNLEESVDAYGTDDPRALEVGVEDPIQIRNEVPAPPEFRMEGALPKGSALRHALAFRHEPHML